MPRLAVTDTIGITLAIDGDWGIGYRIVGLPVPPLSSHAVLAGARLGASASF